MNPEKVDLYLNMFDSVLAQQNFRQQQASLLTKERSRLHKESDDFSAEGVLEERFHIKLCESIARCLQTRNDLLKLLLKGAEDQVEAQQTLDSIAQDDLLLEQVEMSLEKLKSVLPKEDND